MHLMRDLCRKSIAMTETRNISTRTEASTINKDALDAYKNGDFKEFSKQYGNAKNQIKENNAEIERLEQLRDSGFGNLSDSIRIDVLKKANKTLNSIVNLGNKYSHTATTQSNNTTTPANPTQNNSPVNNQTTGTQQTNESSSSPTESNSPVSNNQTAGTQQSADSSSTSPELTPSESFADSNKLIQSSKDEAGWAYLGDKRSTEFADLEDLTDKLNSAIARGADPKEIQALAKELNTAVDQLQAKLQNDNSSGTANNASMAYLAKTEEGISQLIQSTTKVINSPASKLSDAIDQIPESFKNTTEYKELTALNKELDTAILQGKDTKEIAKKINRIVDNWQANLGDKIPEDLKTSLTNIEARVADVMHSENGEPVTQPDAISIDRDNNIISIDSNKDGKIDYQIKMEGKSQAWQVTKMGPDGKPENSFRVWGDPHVDLDSDKSKGNKTDFNFFEDATFVLKGVDGGPNIKITVDTKRKDGKEEGSGYTKGDVSYSSGLTITTGDQAVKVSGIDDNKVVINDVTGDGQKIDNETNDGTIFIVNDDLSSMDTINESGRSHISDGKHPMYATTFVENEYNEEEAYS